MFPDISSLPGIHEHVIKKHPVLECWVSPFYWAIVLHNSAGKKKFSMTCLDEMLWEHLDFQNVILTTEIQTICSVLGQLWELEQQFLPLCTSWRYVLYLMLWDCLGLAYECCLRPRQIHKKIQHMMFSTCFQPHN